MDQAAFRRKFGEAFGLTLEQRHNVLLGGAKEGFAQLSLGYRIGGTGYVLFEASLQPLSAYASEVTQSKARVEARLKLLLEAEAQIQRAESSVEHLRDSGFKLRKPKAAKAKAQLDAKGAEKRDRPADASRPPADPAAGA